MKSKFKILILLGIAVIASSYFIYDEILFAHNSRTINLDCWGYNIIHNERTSKFINEPVSTKEHLSRMRSLANQNYTAFVDSLRSDKPVNYSNIILINSFESNANLEETIYAILKDKIPDEKPSVCPPVKSPEDINKVMQVSFAFTTAAIWAGWSQNIVYENNEYCTNQTNYNKCVKSWISLLENASETRKNSLPEYKEASLPDCAKTLVYKDSKQVEKEIRNQLIDAKDAFSELWKSMQIEFYDDCSEKYYETIKENSCDLSQIGKVKSVSVILEGNGILAGCLQDNLINETSKLSSELNLTKI